MNALVRYDTARRALAEAHQVDEIKSIRDKALAMQLYAKQAKDGALIGWATDIRMRAERKAGELLREMEKNKGAAGGGTKVAPRGRLLEPRDEAPKLADLGVTKTQSSRWQKLAALDDVAFEARAASAKKSAVMSVEATAAERLAEKKQRRDERERDLAAKQTALPDKRYGVILADPEWRFEPWSRETGLDRAADNHYPTSPLDVIASRDVAAIAAPDVVLFLWGTMPLLLRQLEVMSAWGFTYKSHCVWAKDRVGTGYWFRCQHELLLLGTRGHVPAPAPGTQFPSLIEVPVGTHSAKPEVFSEIIEAMFPSLAKIELNRRGPPRPGWDAWGNEAL